MTPINIRQQIEPVAANLLAVASMADERLAEAQRRYDSLMSQHQQSQLVAQAAVGNLADQIADLKPRAARIRPPFRVASMDRTATLPDGVERHWMLHAVHDGFDPDGTGRIKQGWMPPEGDYDIAWLDQEAFEFVDGIARREEWVVEEIARLASYSLGRKSFGWYGVPLRRYWDRNEDWTAQGDHIAPGLAGLRDVSVSVYDFYVDADHTNQSKGDAAYVAANVAEARRVTRPWQNVWAVVMPVYHDSNAAARGKAIPLDEFRAHVQAACDAGATGVLVWSWNHEAALAEVGLTVNDYLQACLEVDA